MAPIVTMDSLDVAIDFFIRVVTKGNGIFMEYIENTRGKYAGIIDYEEPSAFGFTIKKRYYVLYKRQWENWFGKKFDKPETIGQNITPEALQSAAMDDAIIACVMIDHSVWTCAATDWLRYVNINNTIQEVEWKDKGEKYKEASIPKSMMRKIV